MPHPRAEVLWQIPTTGTDNIKKTPKNATGRMGTLAIDWAIIMFEINFRLLNFTLEKKKQKQQHYNNTQVIALALFS